MPLVLLLICLALANGCVAPAVSDGTETPASSFLDTTFPLTPSDITSDTCHNIHNCRTMVGIITSCLATIFACVWVAVHPNMPGPRQSWVSRQVESFKVVIVTLLVPEWVLAWAVRQFLQAREYAKILEKARVEREEGTLQHRRNSTQQGSTGQVSSSGREGDKPPGANVEEQSVLLKHPSRNSTWSVGEVTIAGLDEEWTKLACFRYLGRTEASPEDLALAKAVLWQLEFEFGRTNQSWTVAHGFFMIMGGFHSFRGGEPMFPLDYENVLALVQSRSLVPPTSDELGDKSKGDTISKSTAVLQTLWFAVQCIARRVENLAITNLEIVTLAYTVITVAMYAAWWHKPLNVRCPIRVKGEKNFAEYTPAFQWSHVIHYVTGDQDRLVMLSDEERVPTFWSSCSHYGGSQLPLYADLIALSVAMVFGIIHCAAWSYAFPSIQEQWMWRGCALAISAIPLLMAAAFAVFDPFTALAYLAVLKQKTQYIPLICMALGALLYIPARILLLVLSFTTLYDLPPSAYQTVQWTTWIPHI